MSSVTAVLQRNPGNPFSFLQNSYLYGSYYHHEDTFSLLDFLSYSPFGFGEMNV